MIRFFLNKMSGNKLMDKNIKMNINIQPELIFNNSFSSDSHGIFTQLNLNEYKIPHQGFKIHVSCTINNFNEILFIVYDFCKKNKIAFKYMSNLDVLKYFLSSKAPRESSGKFITIYPKNDNEFKNILEDLYVLLSGFEGNYILTDKRYKDSKCLYYRFGVMNTKIVGNFLLDPNKNKIEDIRKPFYYLPNFIKEPFEDKDSESVSKLLINYEIIDVIQSKNSGGIYLAVDKNSKSKVVVKEARLNIGELEENIVQKAKQNEAKVLKRLEKVNYIPEFIDEFYDWENYYLVEEYVTGKSFYLLKNSLHVNLDKTNNLDQIIKNYKIITQIFSNTLKAIKVLHEHNLYVGDISDKNIIYNKSFEPKFIDLEYSYFIGETMPKYYSRTSGFYNNRINFIKHKSQDLQQVGYLFMNMFVKSNLLNGLDLTGESAWTHFQEYASKNKIPKVYIQTIYSLIYQPSIEIDNLIKAIDHFEIDSQYFDCKGTKIYAISDYIQKIEEINAEIEMTVYKYRNYKYFPIGDPSRENCSFLFGDIGLKKIFNINEYVNCLDGSKIFNNLEKITFLESDEITINDLKEIEDFIIKSKDFSLVNGISGIAIMLSKINPSTEIDSEKINCIIKKARVRMTNFIDEKLSGSIPNFYDLGLINGMLGVAYYFSIDNKIDYKEEDIVYLEKICEFYLSNFIEDSIKKNMAIKYQGNKYSPYIEDGTCGLILVLLNYLKKLEIGSPLYIKTVKIIEELSDSQIVTYTQNGTLLKGISGIGYTLLRVYREIPKKIYLHSSLDILNNLELYTFKYDNSLHTYTPTFNNISLDLAYGISGFYIFTNDLLDILNRMKVDGQNAYL